MRIRRDSRLTSHRLTSRFDISRSSSTRTKKKREVDWFEAEFELWNLFKTCRNSGSDVSCSNAQTIVIIALSHLALTCGDSFPFSDIVTTLGTTCSSHTHGVPRDKGTWPNSILLCHGVSYYNCGTGRRTHSSFMIDPPRALLINKVPMILLGTSRLHDYLRIANHHAKAKVCD